MAVVRQAQQTCCAAHKGLHTHSLQWHTLYSNLTKTMSFFSDHLLQATSGLMKK